MLGGSPRGAACSTCQLLNRQQSSHLTEESTTAPSAKTNAHQKNNLATFLRQTCWLVSNLLQRRPLPQQQIRWRFLNQPLLQPQPSMAR